MAWLLPPFSAGRGTLRFGGRAADGLDANGHGLGQGREYTLSDAALRPAVKPVIDIG